MQRILKDKGRERRKDEGFKRREGEANIKACRKRKERTVKERKEDGKMKGWKLRRRCKNIKL